MIAAGIKRVVVFSDFHDTLATEFYTKSGVELTKVDMPETNIHYNLKDYSSARKTEKSK
jgi:dCMP deaminase